MELNLIMSIVARSRQETVEDIVHSMKLPLALLVIVLVVVSLYSLPLMDFLAAIPGGLM